ncbi:hypothetical protein [Nonomuraea dietziae]|uniref:hypothetical protein n=1 Tax=Nonomuraea dietziae TaxID=65515 RepID=UPI00341A257C
MLVTAINPGKSPGSAAQAAEWLQGALADIGVRADVNLGDGVALVSVWVNLLVWTDGNAYSWWSGKVRSGSGRRIYAFNPATDPVTAARRVAARREELRQDPERSSDLHDLADEPHGRSEVRG